MGFRSRAIWSGKRRKLRPKTTSGAGEGAGEASLRKCEHRMLGNTDNTEAQEEESEEAREASKLFTCESPAALLSCKENSLNPYVKYFLSQ